MSEEIRKSASATDQRILRAAMSGQRSGTALSEATNGIYSPEEAASRLIEILAENDWLSIEQEKKLMILAARDLSADINQAWKDGEAKPADAINAMKFIAERLDKAEMNSSDFFNRLSRAQAEIFVVAIQAVMTQMRTALTERGRDIPDLEAIVVQSVPAGFKAIEDRVDD